MTTVSRSDLEACLSKACAYHSVADSGGQPLRFHTWADCPAGTRIGKKYLFSGVKRQIELGHRRQTKLGHPEGSGTFMALPLSGSPLCARRRRRGAFAEVLSAVPA